MFVKTMGAGSLEMSATWEEKLPHLSTLKKDVGQKYLDLINSLYPCPKYQSQICNITMRR